MATKEEKKAAKEVKQAEKAEIAQVKAAQKAETTLLKSQGVDKATIKAETKANKTELAQAKALLAAAGKQTLLTQGQPTFLSNAAAYSGQTAANVQNALNNAAAKYDTLGITNASVSGKTKIGLGIDKLVDYDLGKAGSSATKTIERAQQYVGKSFTPEEIAQQGIKIKEVKGAPGLYQYKTGEPGNNVYTFFQKDANGNYVGTGVNRTSTPKEDGGFFSSPLGQALAIGGMIALTLTPGGQSFAAQVGSTLSGGTLAATSTAAKALGLATLRGVSTGLITGDVEKGLIAAATSGAASAFNISGELGNMLDNFGLSEFKDSLIPFETPTGAFDIGGAAGAGILDSAGNLLPSLGEGAFDIGGAVGTGVLDAAGNVLPSLGESAFDLYGATDAAGNLLPSLGEGAFDLGGAAGTGVLDAAGNLLPSLGESAFDLYGSTDAAGNLLPSLGEGAFDVGGAAGTGMLDPLRNILPSLGEGAFDIGGNPDILKAAGVLGTGLTAKELLSGANTVRQAANMLGLGGGGSTGGITGGAGTGPGILSSLGGLLSGTNLNQLAGAGIDYATLQRLADTATAQGRQIGREAAQIGVENQTPFTPYTLTTGAGTATISPGAATATAAAPYEALRQQALAQAQQTLGAINPAQATQQFYQNLEALAGPTRQREQEALLSRLGARGLLGIGRNLPTAGGAVRGVNPFQESLLAAQEQGRIQQALTAQQFGTSEAARQQALAQDLQAQAMGIDTQTMRQLETARALGTDERALAQQNAALRARTALAGLELRAPYEQLGNLAQLRGVELAGGAVRGLFGLPTQAGNVTSGGSSVIDRIFSSLLNQGMSAEQAADYVNSISSGLDISGESAGTQSLIEQMQEYGIF